MIEKQIIFKPLKVRVREEEEQIELAKKEGRTICLWCRDNVTQFQPWGKGDNIRMIQGCDELCAHDVVKVLEPIELILNPPIKIEEDYSPSENLLEVQEDLRNLKKQIEELDSMLGVKEIDLGFV